MKMALNEVKINPYMPQRMRTAAEQPKYLMDLWDRRRCTTYKSELPVFEANVFLKGFTTLLGMTRTGKSNILGLLTEQILNTKQVSCFIVDLNGEMVPLVRHPKYFSMFTKVESLLDSDVEYDKKGRPMPYPSTGKKYAELFLSGKKSLWLNCSDFTGKHNEICQFLHDFLVEVSNIKREMHKKLGDKIPAHLFIFDEVHNFCPRSVNDKEYWKWKLKNTMKMYAQEMLKMGCGQIWATQRIPALDTTVFSQTANHILLPVSSRPDVDYYLNIMPKIKESKIQKRLLEMQKPDKIGACLWRSRGSLLGFDDWLVFRRKDTPDIGGTPGIENNFDWLLGRGIVKKELKTPTNITNNTKIAENENYVIKKIGV